jgi:hypothetical protein
MTQQQMLLYSFGGAGLLFAVIIIWASWSAGRSRPKHSHSAHWLAAPPMPRIPDHITRAEREHPVMKIRRQRKARHALSNT